MGIGSDLITIHIREAWKFDILFSLYYIYNYLNKISSITIFFKLEFNKLLDIYS